MASGPGDGDLDLVVSICPKKLYIFYLFYLNRMLATDFPVWPLRVNTLPVFVRSILSSAVATGSNSCRRTRRHDLGRREQLRHLAPGPSKFLHPSTPGAQFDLGADQ